ncbi:hypothetical protein D7D25_00610 [Proteiniphilum sp. X52]|nr:hypothetical protein D7D25_00610 [Proteiniphilum sp. X52]
MLSGNFSHSSSTESFIHKVKRLLLHKLRLYSFQFLILYLSLCGVVGKVLIGIYIFSLQIQKYTNNPYFSYRCNKVLAQSKNEFVQAALAQITWHHGISLLTKSEDKQKGLFI